MLLLVALVRTSIGTLVRLLLSEIFPMTIATTAASAATSAHGRAVVPLVHRERAASDPSTA